MKFFRAIFDILRLDRTNWKALALCFFAAAVFWFFNALNKNYSSNVQFPLHFEYDEEHFIPVEPLPKNLTLNISGIGWDLLRKRVGVKVPGISIPLEHPVETRKIVAATLSPLISSQVGSLEVKYIVTDTLRLNIEPKITRKLKLNADLADVSFSKDYSRTSPVVILPDSINVEGPKSLVEKLPDSLSLLISAYRIDNSFRESIEVIVPGGNLIRRNPPVAEVMFDVGLMEESTLWVKLKTSRMPWATEVDHDSVSCVFRFPSKERERFMSDIRKVTATIPIIELKKGEKKMLLPELLDLPAYITVLKIDSVNLKKY